SASGTLGIHAASMPRPVKHQARRRLGPPLRLRLRDAPDSQGFPFMRTALLLSFGLLFAPAIAAACPSPSADPATFERLRQGDFAIAESGQRHRLALALLPCLEARDPALRDGTALAALTAW